MTIGNRARLATFCVAVCWSEASYAQAPPASAQEAPAPQQPGQAAAVPKPAQPAQVPASAADEQQSGEPQPPEEATATSSDAEQQELEALREQVKTLEERLDRAVGKQEPTGGEVNLREQVRELKAQVSKLEAQLQSARAETAVQAEQQAEAAGPKFYPGASVWLRSEHRFHPDFGAADAQSVHRLLQRVRLQLRAEHGPLTIFGQVQDARVWGFESSTISNEGNTDLHQGYVEVGRKRPNGFWSVRLGRQEIVWGSSRMIGNLDWDVNARSFDALRISGGEAGISVDAFAARLSPTQTFVYEDTSVDPPETTEVQSTGSQLYGVQLAGDFHEAFKGELYGLFVRERATVAEPMRERTIGSPGLRVFGEASGFNYEVEGYVQFGSDRLPGATDTRDHFAWAQAVTAGYTLEENPLKPGGYLRYSMASAEECTASPPDPCGAQDSNEFYNFFPLNHAYYGMLDLLGWRNMTDMEAQVKATPLPELNASLTYHFFQLLDAQGRWSNAGGATIGGPNHLNAARDLGHEIDLVATWKKGPLWLQPAYGLFIPASAAKALAGSSVQHFFYLWLRASLGE